MYYNIPTVSEIIFKNRAIEIDSAQEQKIENSFKFLSDFSKDKVIYGINTGFGPMAQYRVADDVLESLQYNIIRSHSAGAGQPIPPLYVKAILLARLSTFCTGYSGVHISTVKLIAEMINADIMPVVYEHGSVGASGDLVQLAHIALALIGEGDVIYKGVITPAKIALQSEGLEPLKIHIREGLALLNGTSAMTGIGVVNYAYANKLFEWSVVASAMLGEITSSFDDYFSAELNAAKNHKGQQEVAQMMRQMLDGSDQIRSRVDHFYTDQQKDKIYKDKVQEHYSLRCVPQILGVVWDELNSCQGILCAEFNSASDNPIIDVEAQNVFHGGNFHGDYISYEMDKLKIVITRLAMLTERQMNFLFNDKINDKLIPPFGNLGVLGLNYGLQACQFTATSTTAECQTLSFPNYIHSIPNNNDNQDIVSMGTNSALITKRVIDNAYQVMAIHFMAIIQAVEYLEIEGKLAPKTAAIYAKLKAICPPFIEDTAKYEQIAQMEQYLKSDPSTSLL